jgi:hypothetical protein
LRAHGFPFGLVVRLDGAIERCWPHRNPIVLIDPASSGEREYLTMRDFIDFIHNIACLDAHHGK